MAIEKEFVLTHVVKDVSKIESNKLIYMDEKIHFDIPWKMSIRQNGKKFGIFLHCLHPRIGNWEIGSNQKMKIISATGKTISKDLQHIFNQKAGENEGYGFSNFCDFDEMMKDYVVDDEIIIEVVVKIEKMTGIEKKNLRKFDELTEFSDVVLVVEDQKFYVLKVYLALHSSYFKSLLLGNFDESKKSEVILTEIDVKDFQNFLEALHAEPAIDDTTVTGILHLADMYDAQTVVKNCEKFLMENSEKSMKNKLELAVEYNLKKLKNHCLVNIKTVDDVRSVLTGDLSKMDPMTLASLLRKSVSQESK